MFTQRKYKKRKTRKAETCVGDVTINDFANSTSAQHRPKKSSTNVAVVIHQELAQTSKSWDDSDYDDYDYVREVNDDDGKVSYVLKQLENANIGKKEVEEVGEGGKDYPMDIWYLISVYIKPEDVSTFARICKTSYAVVQSGRFWFGLYRRHYRRVKQLPARLQPAEMCRLFGIRTLVIRALFHMYPPFVERLRSVAHRVKHPDVLKQKMCVLMWHEKFTKKWIYYFKFKEQSRDGERVVKQQRTDIFDLLDDVMANSEEQCRILQVICNNFIPVPPVQQLFLTSVEVTMSHGFIAQRMHLGFHANRSYVLGKIGSEGFVSILLDPVHSFHIVDWWHPLYPYSCNSNLYLYAESR